MAVQRSRAGYGRYADGFLCTNDGNIFADIGERIICGGWINPTTYSVGNTYTPIFNTRYGPGQPIFYLSLIRGKPRIMLYNSSGSLILDESVTPSFSLLNGGWYFIVCVIEPNNKSAQYVVGDRNSGTMWISQKLTFTGELNRSCTADLIMGMHADSYWYAGGFDDWFLDCDSQLTADDLADYFRATVFANGGDEKLPSPSRAYIRFRVTLTTSDSTQTPKLIDIRLYDIPKPPYEKIGDARPVLLDRNGAWEAVLKNAYNIIVTGEVNGEDTLSFSIPFANAKRKYIDNEKKIQIVDDMYIIRKITDTNGHQK